MKSRTAVIGLLVALLSFLSMWTVYSRSEQQSPSIARGEAENTLPTDAKIAVVSGVSESTQVNEILDELKMLRNSLSNVEARADAEVERVRGELLTLKDEIASREAGEILDADDAISEVVAEVEAPAATLADIKAFHEETFTQQAVDAIWSQDESDTLLDHFIAKPMEGVSVSHLECRATACRMELALDHEDAPEAFLARVGQPPFDKGGFHYTTDDQSRLIVFTGRDGHPLPPMDQM